MVVSEYNYRLLSKYSSIFSAKSSGYSGLKKKGNFRTVRLHDKMHSQLLYHTKKVAELLLFCKVYFLGLTPMMGFNPLQMALQKPLFLFHTAAQGQYQHR